MPNTEFGHIEIRGKDAEKRASEIVREAHDLSWEKWAGRVDEYLKHMEALLSPDLFIIGGGVSKQSDKFVPLLTGIQARIVPAAMLNDAGIVGAAMHAHPAIDRVHARRHGRDRRRATPGRAGRSQRAGRPPAVSGRCDRRRAARP